MNTKLLEWRKFKRWTKRIEKKGIVIRRGWGEETMKIYRECQGLFDSPYIKTCLNYWKDVFRNSTYLFRYNRRVFFWDYYYLYLYLIINLTIKGVYFAKFGMSVEHKTQAHECWLAREKLIKLKNIWNFEIYIAKVERLNDYIHILIIKNNLKNLLWNFSQ